MPEPITSGEQPGVAIIALDGAVQLYAETLRYLAWRLTRRNAKVIRLGCSRGLETCTSINSIKKEEIKSRGKEFVCDRCIVAQRKIGADKEFVIPESAALGKKAENFLKKVSALLARKNKARAALNMEFEGLPVCRLAFFDFSISSKVSEEHVLDDALRNRLVAGIRDQLMLLAKLHDLIKAQKISHVLYVNGNYSQNALVCQYFKRLGIPSISVEPQLTSHAILNHIFLTPERLVLNPEGLLPVADSQDRPQMKPRDVRQALANFGARIGGHEFNAYTSLELENTSELAKLNAFLKRFKRTHAYLLSSEDELVPHIQTHHALEDGKLLSVRQYHSQAEFMRYFLKQAKTQGDIGFVVRLHPRMAANKRDNFESAEHLKYKEIFSSIEIPENVLLVYGDSKLSSYYIMAAVDLVIVSWSTVGLEALLLGKPVVSAFPECLMYPLTRFSKQPSSRADMQKAIFSSNDCGAARDEDLFTWLTEAYVGQYFTVAATRREQGFWGQVVRQGYNLLELLGLYNLFAFAVSLLPTAQMQDDAEILFRPPRPTRTASSWQNSFAASALLVYRQHYLASLAQYGRKAPVD